jgi:hypothetical protein
MAAEVAEASAVNENGSHLRCSADRPLPPEQHRCALSVGSGCAFPAPPFLLTFARLQDGAQALDVARHHGKGDVALEARDPVVATAIQPVHLQGVDGGLDRAVAPAQPDERGIAFARGLRLRTPALLGPGLSWQESCRNPCLWGRNVTGTRGEKTRLGEPGYKKPAEEQA